MAENGKENSKITAHQQRAIVALLNTGSVAEAAKSAGVGERTLFRWLADPDFKTELANTESLLIGEATRRLVKLQGKAIDVLEDVLDNTLAKPMTKLRAATAILDYSLKLRELRNIEERLAALEAAYAAQTQ